MNLREKKRGRVGPGMERMTKSLILETDLSDLGSEPGIWTNEIDFNVT